LHLGLRIVLESVHAYCPTTVLKSSTRLVNYMFSLSYIGDMNIKNMDKLSHCILVLDCLHKFVVFSLEMINVA